MPFDRKTLIIPDNTRFEEHLIVTNGDVIICDRSILEFGVKTDGRVFIGEGVSIEGDVYADNDIRSDIFSVIKGNVYSGANVYLGERVKIEGKLSLKGDLDVGDNVEIKEGFEAKGWINIRSPIPLVIYIFIYLLQLLKLGKSEEIDKILRELEEGGDELIPVSETFLFIPEGAIIGLQKSRVGYNMRIGSNCKIIGNYDIDGNLSVGNKTRISGSISSTGDIHLGKEAAVDGNINSKGEVKIENKAVVRGNIYAGKIILSKNATIGGALFAENGVTFVQPSIHKKMKEKVKRFENNTDVVDEIKEILE
ncbi:MAG: polymer-forming cytoskeletal protein [Thermoplasmata archaeon]|nr:polymer-forming cytoskeletal protein [Thermoplasmata archaeon]